MHNVDNNNNNNNNINNITNNNIGIYHILINVP